ncbi:MAG: alpha-ribazole phosphatase family protein [Gammaproteobacteria bacterium]|nr:alpha-ribazole phosphatase family protein [Gammaproteobacteria bacterium]
MRHGLPEGGSRYRGSRIDDPLSERGWAQMHAAVGNTMPWDRVVSSPLLRCSVFARELCEQHRLPLQLDDRLKEVGFGDWEGRSRAEIQACDASRYLAFYEDPVNQRPPGAEPLVDFFCRVSEILESLVANFPGQQVLVVAHAGVIRAAVAHALALDPAAAYRIQVDNAGLTRLCYGGGMFRLDFLNRVTV